MPVTGLPDCPSRLHVLTSRHQKRRVKRSRSPRRPRSSTGKAAPVKAGAEIPQISGKPNADPPAKQEDEHFTPSDHEMLWWRVNEKALELGADLVPASKLGGWKIKELLEEIESFKKRGEDHPAIHFWKTQVETIANLPEFPTTGEIDKRAELLGVITTDLLERFARRAKIVPRSKRWWSDGNSMLPCFPPYCMIRNL